MAKKVIAKTKVFSVVERNGREFVRVNRGGESVMALVVNSRNEVYFVKKTAPDSGRTYLTLPGGMLEKKESPVSALKREVDEELGIKVKPVSPLTTLEILPGYLVGKTHLYHCSVLDTTISITDKNEILGAVKFNLEKALEKVGKGEIADSRTVAALLFFRSFPPKSS